MPTFQFEAMNKAGQPQKGNIDAASKDDALARIRAQGFFPTTVREKKVKRSSSPAASGGGASSGAAAKKKSAGSMQINIGGVSGKLVTQFTRQMSTLQDAGLPILRSLNILADQQKPGLFKNVLTDVASDVEGGASLSEAMSRHKKAFDRLYVKMVNAGEVGGVLDVILQRLAEFMEKSQALRRKVIGAMIYPAVVMLVAVGIIIGIMIFVVPKFEEIFNNFDAELPIATKALIDTANWMAGNTESGIPGALFVVAIPIALFIFMKVVRKTAVGASVIDRIKLSIPVIGKLTRATAIARFTRTLGTLVHAGVPILEAIAITRDTVGNTVFEKMLQKVHDSIREGESFAEPLRQSSQIDPIVANMVDVGEETGELDKMLMKVADNYDEEVDTTVKSLMSLMEPIMVCFLGVTVGLIVIALFMPLPALISSVTASS